MKEQRKKTKITLKSEYISLTTLGWDLALPIFGGVLLGYYLDKLLNSSFILTFVLLIAGIFVGYYNLVKLIELELLRTKAAKKCQRSKRSKL
jgi:predicted F0F1-ATPase subunit